jgi:hypothetical protein
MSLLIRSVLFFEGIVFFLTFSTASPAQTLTYPDDPNGQRHRIDVKQAVLERESVPGNWQVVGPVRLVDVEAQDFPPNARAVVLRPDEPHRRYLLIDCTNQVYRFDTRSRTLERIDRTYFRGHNCYAHRFLRRDTLHSFGGYGFWHTNNILTYFKTDIAEWESLIPLNEGPASIYRGIGGYLSGRDVFVSALSHQENDSEQQGTFRYDWKVWFYHFTTRRWEQVGILSKKVKALLNADLQKETFVAQMGQGFLLSHCGTDPVNRVYLIDPIANTVHEWADTNKQIRCLNFLSEGEFPQAYVFADTIHYFIRSETTTGRNRLEKHHLPLNRLRQEARYLGTFYEPLKEPLNGWVVGGILVGLVCVGAGGVWWWRRKPSAAGVPTPVLGTPIPTLDLTRLDALERRTLHVLLDTHERGGITSEQLTEALGMGSRTPENQRRIRSEIINGLNAKLYAVLHVENAVQRRQADDDRRIAVYQLHPEARIRL